MNDESTATATISADEFQALEEKVLRAVSIIRSEREARAAAEAELATANESITDLQNKLSAAETAQAEVETLTRERETVRQRVEKMLAQMDELL
jgi:uncharacterized protein involved in exopolysaccharide biosynthesis